ncbi:MAG: DUF1223 domain-containing protein [Acidobacteriota bacterium]|nr:DUF1223 domain-containing protein [Acidobacteriota bacterium]
MKQIFIFGFIMVFVCLIAWSLQPDKTTAQAPQTQKTEVKKPLNKNRKTPVLVELFTSEGCSSCPPADRVLAQLEREQTNPDVEIITLALHVDYWNYLGWRDEFSTAMYSERQSGYAEKFKLDSIYTPQMVVDGQTQFVGSNLGTAHKAITDAAKMSKANIELSAAENKLKVKISDLLAGENSYVWLAIAEDNLKTSVKRGENSGKMLDHVSVVREMKLLGNLASTDKNFETEVAFKLLTDWKKENVKFVAFVQGEKTKRVFAVNKYKLYN